MLKRSTGAIHKAARIVVRSARALGNMSVERRAQQLGRTVPPSRLVVDDVDGYVAFSMSALGLAEPLNKIASLAETWKTDSTRNRGNKPYLLNLLGPQDLLEVREIMEMAMHPIFYGAVTKYLGQVPWLVSMTVWLTPPNKTAERSQLYHFDHKDTRQAKIFINLNNVTAESGPLHFLPASASLKVERAAGYSQGRYTDEEIYGAVSKNDVIATLGGKGTGFIVDTARCLHYGSRGNSKERLMLMVNYARANCVEKGDGAESLDPVRDTLIRTRYSDDPARAFSLTVH
jgi:hypothetical protein